MHNKHFREVQDALQKKGIELLSADTTGAGRSLLQIARLGVKAKIYANISKVHGRHLPNLITSARTALKQKGAIFTAEEMAEDQAPPTPEPDKKRRTLTRLSMQEKADLFMLVKSGTAQLVESCETYKISVATGGRILVEGEQGVYDQLMPPEYRSKQQATRGKQVIDVPRESYTDAPAPASNIGHCSIRQEGVAGDAVLTPATAGMVTAKPEAVAERAAFTMVEPRKINPLDPRLLQLAAEVKLMQERQAELMANAAQLGINVVCTLEVDWK